MKTSRLKAIQEQKKIADQGGSSSRKSFINEEYLASLGIPRYKIDEGTHFLAIIPPKDAERYFGIQCSVHFNVGPANDSFICPLEQCRKPCPECADRKRLEQIGESDRDTIYALRPTNRYVFFIVNMKNKETRAQGLQYLEAAFSIQQGIIGVSKNPRTNELIDISDPTEGKTLVFDRVGKTSTNTRYQNFKLEDRDPLAQEWLDKVPDFDKVIVIPSYEEFLESYKGEGASASDSPPWDGNGKDQEINRDGPKEEPKVEPEPRPEPEKTAEPETRPEAKAEEPKSAPQSSLDAIRAKIAARRAQK